MKTINNGMTDEARFEKFVELCKRIFERMEREQSFPWMEDPEAWNRENPEHKVEIVVRHEIEECQGRLFALE